MPRSTSTAGSSAATSRDRTIAFDVARLDRIPVRIGVAGGAAKVRPILGALRGRRR